MDIHNQIINWKSKGKYFNVGAFKIWYHVHNPDHERTIVILHGYPTCSFDYKNILKFFPEHRIVLHDYLGFGLSDKPSSEKYLLKEQADRALALYKHLGLDDFCLFAHDYGTSVATEILSRDNEGEFEFTISKLILSNGSMLINMSQLRPIQKMLKHDILGPVVARLANQNTFIRNMKNIWHDPSSINVNELKILWLMLIMNGGRKVLPRITKYIDQRYENYDRWIVALKETKIETLILWAENDPVAVIEMADVLQKYIPHNTKITISSSGHYPMIESPRIFSDEILAFLSSRT